MTLNRLIRNVYRLVIVTGVLAVIVWIVGIIARFVPGVTRYSSGLVVLMQTSAVLLSAAIALGVYGIVVRWLIRAVLPRNLQPLAQVLAAVAGLVAGIWLHHGLLEAIDSDWYLWPQRLIEGWLK